MPPTHQAASYPATKAYLQALMQDVETHLLHALSLTPHPIHPSPASTHPTYLQIVGQAVCVGKVEQRLEHRGPHILDVDSALVPLSHGARQQRTEHRGPGLQTAH